MHKDVGQKVKALCGRDKICIAVLDSGLGGLSICAELEKGLQAHAPFNQASLLYFNVWPEQGRGYNSLASVSDRIRVFDRALEGVSNFQPDMIMIACNTLSVIYDRTPFSRDPGIPVIDIVDFGVDLIYFRMMKRPGSQALILGTRTTVSEGVHQRKLVQKGIDASRVMGQACHGVATEIEKNPQSAVVQKLIHDYMDEAVPKLDHQGTIYAALCCTHFAYSGDIFKRALLDRLSMEVVLLNPNDEMSRFLLENANLNTFATTDIRVKVISKISLDPSIILSMSNAVRDASGKTAEALAEYAYQPNLF